jgi:serine-type D-Ala-D-Ala carboxypeptidase/endopeptidase (penicillin-binding protein 4)
VKRIALSLLCLAACAQPANTRVQPQRTLRFVTVADSLINASELSSAHWGVEVLDPARNRSLYSYNSSRHFIPASNTKLVVTSVAMGLLGPEHRYRTEFMATGVVGDSVPDRVIAIGSGDPTWSSRFYTDDLTVLNQLADSIWNQGVRAIGSELVIDASLFGPERVHSAWEVGDLPFTYATPTGAFAIGEGVIELVATPATHVGETATVQIVGPQSFPIRSNVRTDTAGSGANLNVDYQSWPDTLVVSGRVGLTRGDTSSFAAPNAVRFAADAFRDALQRKGIRVGSVRVVYDSLEAAALRQTPLRLLTRFESEPMHKIVAGIMQPSQNWIADQLVRTLGALHGGRGTWNRGIEVERRFLIDVVRLDSTSFSLRDASGLSAQNLLSPRATVLLLEYDRQARWGQLFRAAMPTPGLRGSTLSNRLPGLEGKVFAKTGTIANVASLSGYVITRSGRELTFSIMVNASGRSSAQVRRGIDRLITAIAEERDWE